MYDHFTVKCAEKTGIVARVASPLEKLPESVLRVYDRIQTCTRRTGWNDPMTIEHLLNPTVLAWTIDDVGLAAAYPLRDHEAHVHIYFWDRRLRGREELCKTLLRAVSGYGVDIFWTAIGTEFAATLAFVNRLGFRVVRQTPEHRVLMLSVLHL